MLVHYCQQKSLSPIKTNIQVRYNDSQILTFQLGMKSRWSTILEKSNFSNIVVWDISKLCTRISPLYFELLLATLLRVSSCFPLLAQQLNLSWGETNCPLRSLSPQFVPTRVFPWTTSSSVHVNLSATVNINGSSQDMFSLPQLRIGTLPGNVKPCNIIY